MGIYRGVKYVLAFGALYLHLIDDLDALVCDFDHPHGLLRNNALATCDMDSDIFSSATVICPHRVNDTNYVLHPQPTPDDTTHINVYSSDEGKLRSVALSHVVRTESEDKLFWIDSNQSQTEVHIDFSVQELFTITEKRLIFICGPRDLVLSDALQRHLDLLNGVDQMQPLPWTTATPLVQEISKIGKGLGVFYLNRGSLHLPLQGCGSRPSPLFATDEVTVDPVTGTRSCVADPMSKSPIGFLCEGRLEPEDCMKSLLEKDGDVITAPRPYSYLNFSSHRPWVVARYFHELAVPPINGDCRCIYPETGAVNARMEIRTKTEYVCDISSMIFRNRVHPIRGPWCSVVLHPGSTLTIRLPKQAVDPEFTGEDFSGVPFSQLPSAYEYETEFLPKDLTTLLQMKTVGDINAYDEVLYQEAIVGDALELDVYRMSQGEVKLRYHLDKPLALRHGTNSFNYHWTLISRNENVIDRIRAIVNVSFAYNYQYTLLGCDREQRSVFDQNMSKDYCSVKSMKNGIGSTYECTYNIKRDACQIGIYCGSDETLLPNNCESTGYDLYSNRIIPMRPSVINVTPYPIRGFQVLNFKFQYNTPVSYACICINQNGYESSRLILESNRQGRYAYTVRREEAVHTLVPFILLPWHETGLPTEEQTQPRSIVLYNIQQKLVILNVGTTLFMNCESDVTPLLKVGRSSDFGVSSSTIPIKWLPDHPDLYYYTITQMPNGPEVVKAVYGDKISTTQGGFQVAYNENIHTVGYQRLTITSRRGAVIISKDPLHKQFVPMTFVCGKVPETSDLSIVNDGASTSATSSPSNLQTIGSSARYTWNVVEVKVETTDPYMQGCGVTYSSDALFKQETPQLYDSDGQPQFGCRIDIQAAGEAAFYCPAPYVLDPPNCFSQASVEGEVNNTGDLSQSLVASQSNHFVILSFDGSLVGPGETLRQTPPLECRCITIKGAILSTIQIENYYSK
ncbi:hypothetical protein, conserved [Babesia ovata]|uniref:6-Cys domain-containing protein n=1 Tax=Babesia ovata TaxID=189622 RepID=A0A2H6KJD6_9APIC|nr:uncharacterized protein BOVATA_045830 [Babesia ovata]GBE63090.1 hypothetical protein, conserved [Babesia ovata]